MRSSFTRLLILLLASSAAWTKDATIGIYALIDRVTLAPDGDAPNTIRISGWFAVPPAMSSGSYQAPRHGTLYFRLPASVEQADAARKDWLELKKLAGSGRVIGFGQYWVANPNDREGNPHHSLEVRINAEGAAAQAEIYPEARGIAERQDQNDPHFDEIAAKVQEAAKQSGR